MDNPLSLRCPTCDHPLQAGQGECPNCGAVTGLHEDLSSPQDAGQESRTIFQQLLEQAQALEKANQLAASLEVYRKCLDFAEKNQEIVPSYKLTVQTLRPLIDRLEQLSSPPAPSPSTSPAHVRVPASPKQSKKVKRTLVILGVMVPVCLLLGCVGFFLQRATRPYLDTARTSAAVDRMTRQAAQSQTAFPTQTASKTSTPTRTSTRTPSPTPTVPSQTPSRTSTSTPIPQLGDVILSPKDDMPLHFVPAGYFWMGVDSTYGDNIPMHQVVLDAFWIDETEITNAMFARCVNANGCLPPVEVNASGRVNYYGDPRYQDFPAVNITWEAARDYCAWAGRQLPTEAQWEKAARGDKDKRLYPWGMEFDPEWVNFLSTNYGTVKVGSYPGGKSPYGALDMAGNVWEWVADWYDARYYDGSPRVNPTGPTTSTGSYVRRGGSWSSDMYEVRLTYRSNAASADLIEDVGFRCVLPVSP